jgi:hypothetical protein
MFLWLRVLLALLPVPEAKTISAMTLKRFTPSELLLYKIASERSHIYTYVPVNTCMYWYILIQNGFRCTAEKLKKVIDVLCRPLVREIMEDPIFKGDQKYMVN